MSEEIMKITISKGASGCRESFALRRILNANKPGLLDVSLKHLANVIILLGIQTDWLYEKNAYGFTCSLMSGNYDCNNRALCVERGGKVIRRQKM